MSLPQTPTASLNRGMWYVFHDGPNVIRAWGSTWVGLEKIYFNNQLIDSCTKLKRTKQHMFSIGDRKYLIKCITHAQLKWQAECQLWRNGSLLDGLRCKRKKVLELRPTLAHVYLGILLGILGGLLDMPVLYGIVFVGTSIILTLLSTAKTEEFVFEQTHTYQTS